MSEGCDVEVRASTGSKRVKAPRPLPAPPAAAPLLRQLHGPRPSKRQQRWDSFSHFDLHCEWDLYSLGPPAAAWWPPFYLRRRSAVREIVAAAGVVVALADSGVCAALDQESGQPLCFVNTEADEVVRSLYISRPTDALITVSVFSGDAFQQLRVRATPLAALRGGQPHAWRTLFASEVLRWPGFVEFCDVNDVAVTMNAETRTFKVFDLRSPAHPRFHVGSSGVQDLKITSGGALLLTMQPQSPAELALRVLDLADGSLLKELRLPLEHGCGAAQEPCACCGAPQGRLELAELFGRHLLVKEAGGPLLILDIATDAARRVPHADFSSPAAFIHLPFNHSFLAFFQSGPAQLWSFEGQRLASLAHAVLPDAAAINTVYISEHQDLMFAYCRPGDSSREPVTPGVATAATAAPAAAAAGAAGGGSEGSSDSAALGCIRVYSLLTGRQVAVVQQHPQRQQRPGLPGSARRQARLAAAAGQALKHVTSLLMDERTHTLYTGTEDGRLQSWAVG
ncbi:hypothetical protein ABPG75_013566 [Micractinium tetrahymenae]